MSITLYEHNQKAYESALSLMEETGKAAVIHPTGTGKSFIGFKLAEQHPDMRICWLSPSEYIYKTQTENLKSASDGYEPDNIHFMTYAKLMLTDENVMDDIHPDCIILDEFHRCGAVEWGKGVERLLAAYPDASILGLSATNIRYLDNQRDMADELFEGNIASEMTLGEAIAREILFAPTYVVSVYSYQRELEKYQRRAEHAKNRGVRDAARKYLDALRRTLEKADGLDVVFERHIADRNGKFIVFCANADHMREMSGRVSEWFGRVDADPHIYTLYSEDADSAKSFAEFKADTGDHLKLLFCIDMLNEGVHAEDISGVILFRPTISPTIYKQQIGRALSASKNKQPLIFDIVNNFENLYSIGSIQAETETAFNVYGMSGESIVREKFRIIDELRDCRELFNQLQETLTASWDIMYAAAKEYYETHGNLLIPKAYKSPEGDLSVGNWVQIQRWIRKGTAEGILTAERIAKLDSIGMVWDSIAEVTWEQNYAAAKEYYEKHGNLLIPRRYKSPEGLSAGAWIMTQRKVRAGGIAGIMTEERIAKLDAIGMVWEGASDFAWEQSYAEAKRYYETYGHLDVKINYVTPAGYALGVFISNLRSRRKNENRSSALSEERIRQMDEIGMMWDKNDYTWNRNYNAAKEYYEEHGDLNVPLSHKTKDGVTLGIWINNMRKSYAELKLNAMKIKRLEEIGMAWDAKYDREWERNYAAAKEYYEKYGNVDIPVAYKSKDGLPIGKWIRRHRITSDEKSQIKLTDERRVKLQAIGMVWEKVDSWEVRYNLAKEYCEKHGNLDIQQNYVTENDIWLGKWLHTQKQIKRGNVRGEKLTKKQIEKLDSIGMNWLTVPEQLWEEYYKSAETYYREHGHLNVPHGYCGENGKRLERWLDLQKKKRKASKLKAEQIARLDALNMAWTNDFSFKGNKHNISTKHDIRHFNRVFGKQQY